MNMRYLSFILLLIIATACNKTTINSSSNKVTGKWKLTETLFDPGDGSGQWTAASTLNPSYVEFTVDAKFKSTSYFSDFDQYHFNPDSTRIILNKSGSSQTIELFYTLQQAKLSLNPPCDEACGLRYKRVK